MRHFLDIRDHSADTLQAMLDHAAEMKSALKAGQDWPRPLAGKSVAMIFEKPSTRTRVSFEVGISQLGGTPLMLSAQDMSCAHKTCRVRTRHALYSENIRCAHKTCLLNVLRSMKHAI